MPPIDLPGGGGGGGGPQGQQGGGLSLDSLVGGRSAVALTQAQSRLDMTSAAGAAVTVRTAAAALPAAAAAGDRLVAKWSWTLRPAAARLSVLTVGLRDVTGAADLDVIWPVWDEDSGIVSWELPAGCASVLFVGRFDPDAGAQATIDMSAVEMHRGAQGISRYTEGRAARLASLAARQAEERARAYANEGDALNALATDATVTSLVRRSVWARAWIRAADTAAALAGTAAATWTNQGRGTPPTGAHWDPGQAPAGAGNLYEIVSLVSPTAGSTSEWTFGTWAAFQITAANTQYSVDGSTLWHAVRADADRYERHFDGAWGPAIPLYAAAELPWSTLLESDLYHATRHWLPGILLNLPSTINFGHFNEMRIGLQSVVGGVRVLHSTVTIAPRIFVSVPYADRDDATPDTNFIWQLRLNGEGLSVVMGDVPFGSNGPWANGKDAGLSLLWVRPNAVSSAVEAAHLRCVYLRNRGVTHRLKIEVR